jgi:hypothetical protein
MQQIDETIVLAAIRQCLETAEHYVRQGNRRDAEFYLDTADAYATRLILCRKIDDIAVVQSGSVVKPADRTDMIR